MISSWATLLIIPCNTIRGEMITTKAAATQVMISRLILVFVFHIQVV
jgi:hypothetical protein